MIKPERLSVILDVLHKNRKVDAASLSRRLKVSEATIRRDITELHQLGKLLKVHGGALPPERDLPSARRLRLRRDEKYRIAQKALPHIQPGMLVLIDGGSTNLCLASILPADTSATFVTNSPGIMQELGRLSQSRVMMLGGIYDPRQEVVTGPEAHAYLDRIHADLYLMGVCQLHAESGITTASAEEAYLKEKMCAVSQRVIALADAQKLQQRDHYKVGELSLIHTLLTDLDPGDTMLDPYREAIACIL